MEITFLGGTQTVTGSKYLIKDAGKEILVDCGLFQGRKELRLRNWATLPTLASKIDAVILTHAHIDHSGYIPLLVKNGFKNHIYCSSGTKDLCSILLPDSGHLQEEEARLANLYGYSKHTPALPLYTKEEAQQSLSYFHPLDFAKEYAPSKLTGNLRFSLHRAGHILGASFVLLKNESTSLLFSGDIGRSDDMIMNPPVFMSGADYLIVESTYGNRLHSKEDSLTRLADIIKAAAKRGGSIIIPSFAVGRAQTILYMLYQLLMSKKIPNLPIYVDSPMATNATVIYCNHPNEHKLGKQLIQEVCSIAKYITTIEDSKILHTNTMPKIIISASGMATGGRVLHHLQHYLPDHRNSVIFVGFQVPGTRGDRLINGEEEIKMLGQIVPVKAEISYLENLSAHADYQGVLDWIGKFTIKPRKVFITHGEMGAAESLKAKIESQFGYSCVIPEYLHSESI